jgi:hypothetical protein
MTPETLANPETPIPTTTSKYTEDEIRLFKLKRHAIRRSLQSLARKSKKVQKQRFLNKGARKGLIEIRAQTSALLDTYRILKGQGACHGPNCHTAVAYVKWGRKYREMFLAETFTLIKED